MVLTLSAVFGVGKAHAEAIANVTIPFSGSITSVTDARKLIADSVKALLPDATGAGIMKIRLQSAAYTLTPEGNGYAVNGNIFIDVVPESKTADFTQRLQFF